MSEVKYSGLRTCNIFAVVDILRYIPKIISIPVLDNRIIYSRIKNLELLKSLICIEDTENSHSTIY